MGYFTIYILYVIIVSLGIIGWCAYDGDFDTFDEDSWGLLIIIIAGTIFIFPLFIIGAIIIGKKISIYLKEKETKDG